MTSVKTHRLDWHFHTMNLGVLLTGLVHALGAFYHKLMVIPIGCRASWWFWWLCGHLSPVDGHEWSEDTVLLKCNLSVEFWVLSQVLPGLGAAGSWWQMTDDDRWWMDGYNSRLYKVYLTSKWSFSSQLWRVWFDIYMTSWNNVRTNPFQIIHSSHIPDFGTMGWDSQQTYHGQIITIDKCYWVSTELGVNWCCIANELVSKDRVKLGGNFKVPKVFFFNSHIKCIYINLEPFLHCFVMEGKA